MEKVRNIILNNGVELPMVGLGTSAAYENEAKEAVKSALRLGYRHIDTAWFYKNEQDVGAGVRESGIPREEVFITSKVWNDSHGYNETLKAFEVSLNLLQTDYIDMFLIHWPCKDRYIETWKALEYIYKQKKVRAIGVANFLPHHLENLLSHCEIVPAVNQLEAHAYFMDYNAIQYSQSHGMVVEAYSPLACPAGYGKGNLLAEPTLINIGLKHGKTPAQVALRFLLQQDIVVIPKTVHVPRLIENKDIFDFTLSQEEMTQIAALNTHQRFNMDPDTFVDSVL